MKNFNKQTNMNVLPKINTGELDFKQLGSQTKLFSFSLLCRKVS